jgi:hypothetical protein
VPPPWVSEALGHADWAVTARHYARWIPGGEDEPLRREAGEVYPDLLARVAPVGAGGDATRRDGTAFPRDLEDSLGTRPPGAAGTERAPRSKRQAQGNSGQSGPRRWLAIDPDGDPNTRGASGSGKGLRGSGRRTRSPSPFAGEKRDRPSQLGPAS